MTHAQSAPSSPSDVVFVIDTSASMDEENTSTRRAASQLASLVVRANPESRVGLVEHQDTTDEFRARTVLPLTRDVAQFQTRVNNLPLLGDGDTLSETVYSGIATGLCQNWASGHTRALIVIGDGTPHDPEPVTELTQGRMSDLANGLSRDNPLCPREHGGGIQVHAISSEPAVIDALAPLVDSTGGTAATANDRDDIAAAIDHARDSIESAGALSGSIEQFVSGLTGSPNALDSVTDLPTSDDSRSLDADNLLTGAPVILALIALVGPTVAQLLPHFPR